MAEDRNRQRGRGRRRGRNREEQQHPDAPGWNASASGGSYGGGGGYSRGGHSRDDGPDDYGSVHEGRDAVRGESGEYREEARWRGQGSHPEAWVGEPRRGGTERGFGRDNPYGTQPQGWRGEDDFTLSPARQAGRQGTRGPYTGLGPADYVRSDDRIREDVCDRLTEHGGIDAREVRVQVDGGEVTLQGEVEERVEKFMAEEVADTVVGVREVHNRIRLRGRNRGRAEERGGERGDAR